jgi:hypothetical protein
MSKIAIDSALRQSQERFVNNILSAKKHRIADSYYKAVEEDCANLHEKGIASGLISNFAKIMDSDKGVAFTTSNDFGPYVMEVWPLVTAWYPEFPLKDLISVQDMDKPLGYLFFSALKTGTAKADTAVGEVVETATGPRTIRGRYPSGEIFGEVIDSGFEYDASSKSTQALLAYCPLNVQEIPGYLKKTRLTVTTGAATKTYVVLRNEANVLHFAELATPTVDAKVTVDVQTGLISIPETGSATTVTKIVANYVWNLDFATPENIQKVKETIEMVPMEATPRALALEWTLFSEFLKKSQFGQDIRTDNTKRILSLIYQYQIRYILDEMYDYAEGNGGQAVEITLPNSTAISLDIKAQQVMQDLKNVANIIEIASGRVEGNRIVCGKNFKSFCESLPNTWFTPSKQANNYGFSAPREIGTFGTFKVYYDPTREANEAFMTYRGEEFYDAAYYLGEYMPVVPTDAVALGVTVRESFVSMEAYKFHKPNCVVKVKFENA